MDNLESSSFRESPNSVLIEFSKELLKFGGSQKFIVMEDPQGKIFFATNVQDHIDIRDSLENKFNKNLVSKGGGFLSYDPYDNVIKIQNGYSTKLGPITISKEILLTFLKENISQYNFEIED